MCSCYKRPINDPKINLTYQNTSGIFTELEKIILTFAGNPKEPK